MAQARSRLNYLIILGFLAAAGFGLWLAWQLLHPKPGPLRLMPVAFPALPGWQGADPRPALAAFGRSCAAIEKMPAAAPLGGAGYAGTARDWQGVCAALPPSPDSGGPLAPAAARQWFEARFQPVQVSAGQVRQGLFTGYYEPQLAASRSRHGAYRIPVYGLPDDLITIDLGQFRPALKGTRLAGRLKGRRLVPYPDRAEIDAKGLPTAPVLFWAKDPVAVFFLQIQGSGRAVFDDGGVARVAYAGQNGQPYTAIGRTLIQMGAIPRQQMSLQSIRAWLLAHPADARKVMEGDASFVFFRMLPLVNPALGADGSEAVPLTPRASLAVDARLHALGVPVYVAATAPDPDAAEPDRPFDRLLVAQDTGGAIAGPVRGDVFWGFGKKAEAIAGRMKAPGAMYVLLPKPLAAKLGVQKDYPETAP